MKFRNSVSKCVLAAALLVVGAVTASAQEVTVNGSATGRFNSNGPAFTAGLGCTNVLVGLTYCGSTFSDLTSGGFVGFGGNSSPGSNFNNFGSFALASSPQVYTGQTFDLMLTISSPTGIVPGGQNQMFSSLIRGSVNSTNNGGIFIDFDNTARNFTFSGSSDNPSVSGNGSLVVNDMSLNSGQVGAATGYFEATGMNVVPEPSTYALLSAGLAGLGIVARRRKRNA